MPEPTLRIIGIITTYNCSRFLRHAYTQIPRGLFAELIVVDDGSADMDATKVVAEQLGLPFFTHPHLGYGGNLKYGFAKALERGATYIIEIHGDGQYETAATAAGVEKITKGYDLVLGSRFVDWRNPLKDGMPFSRYFANIGLSFFARLILRIPLTEFHSGFRIYSRRLLEAVNLKTTSNDYLFSFQIIAQAGFYGFRVGEIPVRCDYRSEHTSISMGKAAWYSLRVFSVLFQYLAARIGIQTQLFRRSE